jgi:8-oxo-dGTP pyrophosphatase MutT (NUDIX family)
MSTPMPSQTTPPSLPRPAATVILMRDSAAGVEIFMVKRAGGMGDVLGGAYVFPGGKVDAADAQDALWMRFSAVNAAEMPMNTASSPEDALRDPWGMAFSVAAIRETFEEAGVLLGAWRDGVDLAALRARLNAGEAFSDLAAEADMRFNPAHFAPYTRWVTPEAAPKRFDARFFLAAMPNDQQASFDDKETTEGVWVTAAQAYLQVAGSLACLRHCCPGVSRSAIFAGRATRDHADCHQAWRRPGVALSWRSRASGQASLSRW